MNSYRKKQHACLMLALFLTFAGLWSHNVPHAKAAPLTFYVSPSSAPVGSTITLFGTGATPNGEVRMYVYGQFWATATADESGNYSINMTVPTIPKNSFYIYAIDIETGNVAQAPFMIEQRIILSSTKGSPLDTVTVRGDGFEYLSNVTIYFDGIDVTPPNQPQTDYFGSFETTFTVPLRPNGTYTVMAQSQGFWIISAEAEFTIVPKITFWPQSSGAQTYRWINCYGYAPSVSLTA